MRSSGILSCKAAAASSVARLLQVVATTTAAVVATLLLQVESLSLRRRHHPGSQQQEPEEPGGHHRFLKSSSSSRQRGDYLNVLGDALQKCSGPGMALTGFTRTGHCVAHDDDAGSHHVCIDMSSNTGVNFCTVTGQSNWCASSMGCDGGGGDCPIEHWCVYEWAFAKYIEKAGGCDKIQTIVCEATNMKAITHCESQASSYPHIANALACLKSRCLGGGFLQVLNSAQQKENRPRHGRPSRQQRGTATTDRQRQSKFSSFSSPVRQINSTFWESSPVWQREEAIEDSLALSQGRVEPSVARAIGSDPEEAHYLCRVRGGGGGRRGGEVAVVLNARTNERALFFESGKRDSGGETRVKCANRLSDQELKLCLQKEGQLVTAAEDCPPCPCHLAEVAPGEPSSSFFPGEFAYMRRMAQEVVDRCSRRDGAPSAALSRRKEGKTKEQQRGPESFLPNKKGAREEPPFRILVLGMGGGAMSSFLHDACGNNTEVESVEYLGNVAILAESYFGFRASPSNTLKSPADALEVVQRKAQHPMLRGTYDAVLVDCFLTGGVTPPHCRSQAFLEAVAKLLPPDGSGLVMQNLWNSDPEHAEVAGEFNATLGLYRQTFGSVRVLQLPTKTNNVLMAY